MCFIPFFSRVILYQKLWKLCGKVCYLFKRIVPNTERIWCVVGLASLSVCVCVQYKRMYVSIYFHFFFVLYVCLYSVGVAFFAFSFCFYIFFFCFSVSFKFSTCKLLRLTIGFSFVFVSCFHFSLVCLNAKNIYVCIVCILIKSYCIVVALLLL